MGNETALMNGRLRSFAARVKGSGLDAYLVSGKADIEYLAGFFMEHAMVMVPARGRPAYIIDPMNDTLARQKLTGLRLEVLGGKTVTLLLEALKKGSVKKLGFDAYEMSAGLYLNLKGAGKWLGLKHSENQVKKMRAVKGRGEIRLLRQGAKKTLATWKSVSKEISAGMTEKELAGLVDVCIRKQGYENSFPTIAAFGENTAFPHAVPTGKKLRKGEHALVDFGMRFNGYCSDLTRTYAEGRINRKISDALKDINYIQNIIIKAVRPGISIGPLVRYVNSYFKNKGLGPYIRHGLGHGLGLEIHEEPFLRETSRERLKTGMVVTLEPGLYMPGEGGVRTEDMVVVTKRGCEVLTR